MQQTPFMVRTDTVLFTVRDKRLQVLLQQVPGQASGSQWCLPGGLLQQDEDLDVAARRVLAQATGLNNVFLEQLYSFATGREQTTGRVLTIAYFALIPVDMAQATGHAAQKLTWFDWQSLPEIAFAQLEIVQLAQQRLAAKLEYSTIAFQFMPAEFTLSQLQAVYEIILQAPVDKRNFRKRIMALACLEETGGQRREGAHRPAKLYRVKQPDVVEYIK